MPFKDGRSVGVVGAGVALAAVLLAEGGAVDAQGRPAATRQPAATARQAAAQAWPAWRGPLGTGEAPAAKPPLEWSETKNVKWKVALPGLGKSSPIVWRDTIYVTSAVPGDAGALKFSLIALNRADGKEKWTRVLRQEKPHEGHHPDGTFAGGSAITDGTRLYAWFGSRGLYAVDFSGKVLWEKSFGQMQTRNGFGEGSSVAVHDGTLVVPWDHEGADFVVGLDAATGAEKWRTPRDEPTTWSTPLIVAQGGTPQVVLSGTNKVIGYDLGTGAAIWQTGGTTVNAIPSPVFGDGLVIAMAGFRGSMARAIRIADAKGNVDGTPAQVWTYTKDTPYVPSPLLYRGSLYFLKVNTGILTNLDVKTGAVHYTERLTETPNVYASPVGADGRVYVVGREGKTAVLEAGPTLKVLATNTLDDATDTSPALVDGEIYLRGARSLYRISAD
jgi:outer membrane protein assembly factor BamB